MIKIFKDEEKYYFQENENDKIELMKFNIDKRNPDNSIFFILPENSMNRKSISKKLIDEKNEIIIEENSKREYSKRENIKSFPDRLSNDSYLNYLSEEEKEEIKRLSEEIEKIRNLGKERLRKESKKKEFRN